MRWGFGIAGLLVLALALALDHFRFHEWVEVKRGEARLASQTMIYAHQIAYDGLNHFGILVRDLSTQGTIALNPNAGKKRYGIQFLSREDGSPHPQLLFRFCDPRLRVNKAPVYGLEDVEWIICKREGTLMTATVHFLDWADSGRKRVATRIDVNLRDLTVAPTHVWKTLSKNVEFSVPDNG